MPTRDLTLAMVGSGGDGVVTMGEMMAQAGARDGLNVIKVEAYGPQIPGGESSCTLRMSAEPISAQVWAVYLGSSLGLALLLWLAAVMRYRQEKLAIST